MAKDRSAEHLCNSPCFATGSIAQTRYFPRETSKPSVALPEMPEGAEMRGDLHFTLDKDGTALSATWAIGADTPGAVLQATQYLYEVVVPACLASAIDRECEHNYEAARVEFTVLVVKKGEDEDPRPKADKKEKKERVVTVKAFAGRN